MKRLTDCALLALLTSLSALSALADTIEVPGDFPIIQAAIDHAVTGDTVLVMAGTYEESIDFKGKAIMVKSQDGPEFTKIDGMGINTVVKFINNETGDSVLDGFTVSNGYSVDGGGGIRCVDSSPLIKNNRIEDNKIDTHAVGGGGVCCQGGAPEIRDNLITRNTCINSRGAGIYFETELGTIINNHITKNGQEKSFEGGGIYVKGEKAQAVFGNFIGGNEARYGGGLYLKDSTVLVQGNTIDGNIGRFGGGINCRGGSPTCRANRIVNNYAWGKWIGGGGICCRATSAVIVDNLIAHNECPEDESLGGGIYCSSLSPILVANNMVFSNTAVIGGGICCWEDSAVMVNNTVVANKGLYSGGGLCCIDCEPMVHNSIFWHNEARNVDELLLLYWGGNPCSLTISHSDVEGGQSEVYAWPGCTLNWGAGMIDGDPLFVDPAAGDYHLIHPSPCRDSGDGSAPGLPDLDFEGDPRVALGGVDMGADEFHTHLYCTGETVPGGHVRIKITDVPGLNHVYLWAGSYVSGPVPTPYGEWYLAPPILATFELGPVPTEGVHVLPIRIPSSCPGVAVPLQALAQDTLTNPCIVDIDQ